MSKASLVGPTDEWQFREWCRTGLRNLLDAVGDDAFDVRLLPYLRLIVRADRVATVWTGDLQTPRVSVLGEDDTYRQSVRAMASLLPNGDCFDLVAVGRPRLGAASSHADEDAAHLRRNGLAAEIRMAIPLDRGGGFAAFLGRNSGEPVWPDAELHLAERSLSLLRSVVIAHARLTMAMPGPTEISAESRLMDAFAARGLSARECQIAAKVLLGYSSLAIAIDLNIAENTVKVHRKHLNQKLGARSQAELFGFAYNALMEGRPPD